MRHSGFRLGVCSCRLPRRQHQQGSALAEYTSVALFLVLVLVAGEQTHTIHYLADKVREAYASFVYALSISWT